LGEDYKIRSGGVGWDKTMVLCDRLYGIKSLTSGQTEVPVHLIARPFSHIDRRGEINRAPVDCATVIVIVSIVWLHYSASRAIVIPIGCVLP
jgi:hypothetical protein